MIRILTSGGVYPDLRDQPGGSQAHQVAGSLRVAVACVLMMGFVMGGQIDADDGLPDQTEPPVRLKKKKVKPQPDAPAEPRQEQPMPKKAEPPPKPGEPKEDAEPNLQDLEEKIREITNRLAKNMSQAEQRLQKHDPGEATQQTQRDIVRDLDELIAHTMRQQQQQQQQQSSSPSSSSGSQRQQTRKGGMQGNQATGSRPVPGPNPQAANSNGGNTRAGKRSQEESNKIADLYKDVWGHLPETLRQEMDQYSREQFMAKYGDLLKQYYATIAEKGRRKAEQ